MESLKLEIPIDSYSPQLLSPVSHRYVEMFTGMDCFADDRDALNDYAKYFNNSHLSDVSLLVGEEIFPAHRIVLCKSSEVFDRMLSTKWNGDKKEMELVEDPHCQKVFAAFLRFLYCNHLVLNPENALPLLVLADKYNVHGLKKVCLEYAVNYILPELSLKDLFHVWYSYATKAYHQVLIHACIQTLARDFEVIITSEDWEKEWMAIDRDQLIELLKSNELVLRNEFILWQAILKWMSAPNHPERRGNTASPLLVQLLPLIRFPFMSGDDLSQVEKVPVVESQARLFHPQMLLAYKFQALPLASRVSSKEFMGTQFLLRNYTDVGWAKRFTVSTAQLYDRNIDHCFTFKTRSSTFPQYSWNWIFKFSIQTYPNAVEEARVSLMTEDIDQPRSVEYLLAVVDEKKVLRSLAGKKTFTKTRYCTELDLQKQITVTELFSENSPLLSNGNLNLQLILKPID